MELSSIVRSKRFIGYELSFEEAILIVSSIQKMATLDFSHFDVKLIDWDSARFITDTDEANEEISELIADLLPGAGPFWWFSDITIRNITIKK
jgi:hypothetical protein